MDVDTIAAVATPAGAGGIGIIKVSGPKAMSLADTILRSSRNLSELQPHHLYHGYVIDPNTEKTIDEVLYVAMKAPHSYTREDVLEIQAHGSRCGLHRILELVLKQDIRMAEPGEFTKRAFLNGRIDLAQAEAVVELISAQTAEGLDLATKQLTGGLSRAIEAVRGPIKDLLVEIEAAIDFPEDVEEIIQPEAFARILDQDVLGPLEKLLAHYDEGHVYREGISAIIIGRPNVGKSSLMNCLLKKERAIVTTIPGTTRDFIEETVNIQGIPLRLIDTAGLHDTDDRLEAMGMAFTKQRLDEADIVLFMIDSSEPATEEDVKIFDMVKSRKAILAINKTDLSPHAPIKATAELFLGIPSVQISALLNKGIGDLKKAIFSLVTDQRGPADLPGIVPNLRHKLALERALSASKTASHGVRTYQPAELVAIDLKDALDAVGEVVGATTTEDILNQIFNRFCIGK
jgi:tRNA modification GTPase